MIIIDSNYNVIHWHTKDVLKVHKLLTAHPADITEEDEVMYENIIRNTSWYGKLRLVDTGLRFVHLVNGIIVCDIHKKDEKINEYKTIAQILSDRTIKWHIDKKDVGTTEVNIIIQYANTENPTVSITQEEPVFTSIGKARNINYSKDG